MIDGSRQKVFDQPRQSLDAQPDVCPLRADRDPLDQCADNPGLLSREQLVPQRSQLVQRITTAIAKDRDVTFHELQAIWRDTGEKVAKLSPTSAAMHHDTTG